MPNPWRISACDCTCVLLSQTTLCFLFGSKDVNTVFTCLPSYRHSSFTLLHTLVGGILQDCSHQIWSGQVSGAYVSTQQIGGSGSMLPPPENFWNLEAMRLKTISWPKRCFSEARRQSFTCMNIYPSRCTI